MVDKKKKAKPRLECTRDYSKFKLHKCNRPLHKNPVLEHSMKKHGFMPSSPIHCIRNGDGTLSIIRGHHRFDAARRLGLEIYYVVDESNSDIFDLEGSTQGTWSSPDFAFARSVDGHKDIAYVLEFKEKHNLSIGVAASLVGGESAASNNKLKQIKTGTFKRGDMKHANDVVQITDLCRDLNIPFATTRGFVAAVSMVLRVPGFNIEEFCRKLRLYPNIIGKRSKKEEYLEEIEELYNYRIRKRIPLQFRAIEIARGRAVVPLNKKDL